MCTGLPRSWCPDKSPCPGSRRLPRAAVSCLAFHSRYDAENRLTGLATGGTSIGTYAYDGAGDRIAKTTASGTTAYTLDLASSLPQVIAETKGSSTTTYAFAGSALEIDQAGTTYWYQDDTLGSVRMLTDALGNQASSYNYSAFGATRTSSGSVANEVRFSGERTDTESGLEFLRARTYDPATGTFLSRDTFGITPTDGQSLDLYAYTQNDPIDRVDPSGHCSPGESGCVQPDPTPVPGPHPTCSGAATCPKSSSKPSASADGPSPVEFVIAGLGAVHDMLQKALEITKKNRTNGYSAQGKFGPADIPAQVAADTAGISRLSKAVAGIGYALQAYSVFDTYRKQGAGPALKEAAINVVSDGLAVAAGVGCEALTAEWTLGTSTFVCIGVAGGVGLGSSLVLNSIFGPDLKGVLVNDLAPSLHPQDRKADNR
jgi:RHS repeat-associated protein